MDVIELTRQLGHALQKDERYIAMDEARKAADQDADLQEMIGLFNLKRLAINNEASEPDPDNDKIQKLNEELRDVYSKVMANDNMAAYNATQEEFNALLTRIVEIIKNCSNGEDPDTTDYVASSCGGNCGSCGGCH